MSDKTRFGGLTSDDMFGRFRRRKRSKNLAELEEAKKEFGVPEPEITVRTVRISTLLETIKGIGKVTANRMREIGIPDVEFLAECTVDHCDLKGHRFFLALGWTEAKFEKFVNLAKEL